MTDTTIEVVPQAPPESPPTASTADASTAGPEPLPGIPLAVAGANAVGAVAAGASAAAGPVGLAAAGAVVGVAALGAGARRIARRRDRGSGRGRRHPLRAASRRTTAEGSGGSLLTGSRGGASAGRSGRRSGAGVRAVTRSAGRPTASTVAGSPTVRQRRTGTAPAQTSGPGRDHTATGSLASRRTAAGGGQQVRLSKSPSLSGRRSGGGWRAAAGGLAAGAVRAAHDRYQAGAPGRAAKRQERAARREAKGQAKARKDAGLNPDGTPARKHAAGRKEQQRALRRSALRHAARMSGSAALAAGVGLLSALWNFKRPGVARQHMRAVWERLASRARSVRARRDAAIRGENAPGTTPVPAETVNDPNRREKTGRKAPVRPGRDAKRLVLGKTDTPGGTVSDTTGTAFTRLSEAAEVMLQAASTFDPEHMNEFQTLVDDLPIAMETVQETLRVLAELSDEKLPVHPRVVEEIGEGYRVMNKVIESLEEVGVVYRRVHAGDIERNENPRKGIQGERRWNVA
ncbi:hypothetical protein [Streptomyces demainii]|uniref:Uncharacterized protein n=1 Tax=Streptomyces demainii TaxID=588122 RepID=A0ABT9KN30_9ACTN|nr:hypothetical protein [Streptomyces demainii]MDP9609590.1 hypothetical protein [Streptomyces demainii]